MGSIPATLSFWEPAVFNSFSVMVKPLEMELAIVTVMLAIWLKKLSLKWEKCCCSHLRQDKSQQVDLKPNPIMQSSATKISELSTEIKVDFKTSAQGRKKWSKRCNVRHCGVKNRRFPLTGNELELIAKAIKVNLESEVEWMKGKQVGEEGSSAVLKS